MATEDGDGEDYGFPARLRLWLRDRDNASMLLALAQLRDDDFPVAAIIETLLNAPATGTLKGSWELWEALLQRRAEDIEALLLEHVPPEILAMARRALWGDDPHPPSSARLRVVHL